MHAGIYGWSGQLTTILSGEDPCLRYVLPKNLPKVKLFPVLGATPGLLAILQTMEVVKIITCLGKPLVGKLLLFDGEDINFGLVKISRNQNCLTYKEL